MNLEQVMQIVILTQDAKEVGWDFTIENNKLKAVDTNYNFDPIVFESEDQLLEWLETQFDVSG
ncbi:hypothetical protein H1D32_10785 [Anaerobacillus sp. CMMVII]|uniref:hypothetical protein n=1 Tax=Anaerobacillus sp. CMMVII TaxID=2755588 RepID=UPI0021B7CE47|nr:hypothetical protein [Anaerobacillus sp. CMMVII]MCT8138198.1 hypothetical protein [Anaerobacillus sp. CMMVII]